MILLDVLSDEAQVVVVGLGSKLSTEVPAVDGVDGPKIASFKSTYKAFRYLEREVAVVGTSIDEVAVICEAKALANQSFLFVRHLRRDPRLSNVPIIALDRFGTHDGREFLRNGVDDCYRTPVDWALLRTRIAQIREYRLLLEDAQQVEFVSEDAFALPPGKRAFDVAFSLGAIAVFALPMLAIALAIRLSSRGDILYKSKRIGTGYEEFEFLKFRSMIPDADKRVGELLQRNQYGADGVFLKVKNDPRVTWIGRVIRNTSLDELPQLFNVLRGDMSIVGNRPLPLREAERLTSEEWSERFLAPAGITGMWQTSGRGKDTMDVASRMTLDIQYARTYSPWQDLKILFKTFGAMKQDADV